MKRLLALVVTLAMVLSVLPTSVLALETDSSAEPEVTAAGETVVDTTDPAEEEKPLAEEEKPAEETSKPEETPAEEAPAEEALPEEASEEKTPEQEAAVSYPAQDFKGKDNGVTVDVTAEEGAFPEGTTMKVTKVTDNNVIAAVKDAVEGEVATVKAVDIAFFNAEGTEIEPLKEIHVKLTSDVVKQAETPVVVHVDDEGEAKVVEDTDVKKDAVEFDVDAFSVYAVVEPGSTVEEARATVNFISKGSNIATVYVKNSDTAKELETIIYDPGVGTLGEGEMFLGWTRTENYNADSERMTVDDVRDYMEKLDIEEGDVVNLYAVISKVVTLTYKDEKGVALGSHKIQLIGSATSGDVTVNMAYTPGDSEQNFEGWIVQEGASNITKAVYNGNEITGGGTAANPYQNETVLTITGNVTLSVDAPAGHWLVFDENGKGATYNAPQFVKSGETTARPRPDAEMQRFGYTFGGWYTDKNCTNGNEFTFGNELTESTTIYAKWTAKATANYTVLIWKQNVSGNGYDFAESIPLSGSVDSTINTVTAAGSGDNRYARINNRNYQWTGFHLNKFDQNVKIVPEGTAVVNVYYDRTEYTLTFQVKRGYIFSRWETIKEIKALYQQNISDNFPIDGYDGYVLDPQNSNIFTTGQVPFLDVMPAENTVFHLVTYGGNRTYHLKYYFEALPTDTDTVTYNGTEYTLHIDSTVKAPELSSTKSEDFIDFVGFTQKESNPTYGKDGTTSFDSNNTISLYYSRNKYPILYMDGVYVDGDGNPVEGYSSRGKLNEVQNVVYGSNTSSYNKGGANYYEPAFNGFVFAGWYTDDKCTQPYTFTTMPEGGITVYAKWVQTQYRVFLHPNAGPDTSLDWGSESQAMTFRVSNGGKVSVPTGTRNEYEMIGWYLDEGCTKVFNADAYTLNDTTVTAAYDKTKDMTDPMDKWGNGATKNSDVDRPWITKKLDIYAKWHAVLVGANGIGVLYDANGGTNAPTDKTLYLDSADAVAQAAPTAPAGKQFKHWVVQKWDKTANKYVDTEVTVEPGAIYTVLKANAKVEEKQGSTADNPAYTYTVQLRAEYGEKEEPASTQITWYSNVKDVNGNSLDLSKFTTTTTTQDTTGGWCVTDKEDGTLRINEAINIRPADTFAYEGATFLGWAKTAGATKDDLFLKYEGGKFYAQAKEGEGDWNVEVTQVAADERHPVDDLYAVWEGSFFIYHSGTAGGNIETHKVEEIMPYTYADSSKLYGGYYLEGGVTPNAAAYDGSNWTWTTPQTSKSYTPKVGETIYLKEVPTTYLLPAEIDTFHKNTKQLHGIYLMSSTDDKNYKEAGYVVGGKTYQKGDLYNDVTIVPGPNSDFAEKTLKVNDVSGNTSGLILMAQYLQLSGDSYTGFGSAKGLKTIKCYWVTPDGITVTGAKQRAVTVKDANKDGVIKVQQTLPEVKYKDAKVKIGILVR